MLFFCDFTGWALLLRALFIAPFFYAPFDFSAKMLPEGFYQNS
jgi:hypothetical protein